MRIALFYIWFGLFWASSDRSLLAQGPAFFDSASRASIALEISGLSDDPEMAVFCTDVRAIVSQYGLELGIFFVSGDFALVESYMGRVPDLPCAGILQARLERRGKGLSDRVEFWCYAKNAQQVPISVMFPVETEDLGDRAALAVDLRPALERIFGKPAAVTPPADPLVGQPAPPPAAADPAQQLEQGRALFQQHRYPQAAEALRPLLGKANSLSASDLYLLYTLCLDGYYPGSCDRGALLSGFMETAQGKDFLAIGLAQLNGASGYQASHERALPLLQKAHSLGQSEATYRLGVFWIEGQGLPTDIVKGEAYLEEAGQKGFANAYAYLLKRHLKAPQLNCAKAQKYLALYTAQKGKGAEKYRDMYEKSCAPPFNKPEPVSPGPKKNPQEPTPKITPVKPVDKPVAKFVGCTVRADCPNDAPISWKRYTGALPANAVSVAPAGASTQYVCRCAQGGGVHAGKVVAGKCNIGYGGQELTLSEFEVAVGGACNGEWAKWEGFVPTNAVVAGSENGKRIFAVRASHQGAQHAGKFIEGAAEGSFGFGGQEIWLKPAFILVNCKP